MTLTDPDPRQINDNLFPFSGSTRAQLRFLLNYAVLAPSHYNEQPWQFVLCEDHIDVRLDPHHWASYVDPHKREAIISCGAAIAMCEVAAKYFGISLTLSSDKPDDNVVASLYLAQHHDPTSDDIHRFNAIRLRQTNRRWHINKPIPANTLSRCLKAVNEPLVSLKYADDEKTKRNFADLTQTAVTKQLKDDWFKVEFLSQLSSTLSSTPQGLPVLGFTHTSLPTPLAWLMFCLFDVSRSTAEYTRNKIISGSQALIEISTSHDTPVAWINTGRVLSRLLLNLTSFGISASFLNQVIQIPTMRPRLTRVFNGADYPQLILRVGYADCVEWTPRRSVESCVYEFE